MKKNLIALVSFALIALVGCNLQGSNSEHNNQTSNNGISTSIDDSSMLKINVPSENKLNVGDVLKLSVQANSSIDVSNLKWVTSDYSVALVDSNGVVRAVSKGTALITVTDGEITSKPISINVDVIPVASLNINNKPHSISVGETIKLETSILPNNANQNVEITSSHQAIEVDSTNKTLKAIKYIDEEVTIKVFASKDFSKVEEFKIKVNPLDLTKKISISFDTGIYAAKQNMEVVKGSVVESITYDPFSNVEDKNSVSDIVFFGFYFDEKFVNPVTFPLTSTFNNMTLYAKFVDLKKSGNGYDWNYETNEDGTYKAISLNTYSTSILSNLSVGIPSYHDGKKVTTFNKISTNDFVNNIKNFALPNTITSLPKNAIQYWKSLEYLYIPSNTLLTSLPEYCLSSLTKLKNLYIPDTVKEISKYALSANKSLTNIHLPENLETIGEYGFGECESLEELNFTSVKSIDQFAFSNMKKLKYVNFPSNLEKLSNVFPFMKSTEKIVRFTVDKNNKYYSSDDFGSLYNKDQSTLFVYANGKGGTNAYIPNTVKTIFDQAFAYSTLEVIKLPSSVTTLEYAPFYYMSNLKAAYIPKTVTTIKYNAFSLCDYDKLVIYTEYSQNNIPNKWNESWNYNSNNDQMEKTEFNTIYDFDSQKFNF